MRRLFPFALVALGLCSCQPVSSQDQVASTPAPADMLTGSAKAGYDLSEALCSGCHAIKPGEISPNPHSPTFAMIANKAGLTQETLADFLRNSHNFPETMNFEVVEEDGDALAAYMITLRRDDFTPPIQ